MSFVLSQCLIWYGDKDVPVGVSWVVHPPPHCLKRQKLKT